MTGDMDTRKYLPLETESIYELNDNTEIFCPESFLEWWSRSLRIILTGHKGSAAEAEQILRRLHDASLYLLSFKSGFLSWYYDFPEPNNEISRQLILMLGSLQLYSKHRQTKSNILRRCWLRAIESDQTVDKFFCCYQLWLRLSNFRINIFSAVSCHARVFRWHYVPYLVNIKTEEYNDSFNKRTKRPCNNS